MLYLTDNIVNHSKEKIMKVTLRIENTNITTNVVDFYHESLNEVGIPTSQSPIYHLDVNTVAREHARVLAWLDVKKYMPPMHTAYVGVDDYDNFVITNVITNTGNVITVAVGTNVTFLCYTGSRGRLIETLSRLKVKDNSQLKAYHYQTTGPRDMYPWEDAYEYTVRAFEEGNSEPMTYWLDSIKESITADYGSCGLNMTQRHLVSYNLDKVPDFTMAIVDPDQLVKVYKYDKGEVAYWLS